MFTAAKRQSCPVTGVLVKLLGMVRATDREARHGSITELQEQQIKEGIGAGVRLLKGGGSEEQGNTRATREGGAGEGEKGGRKGLTGNQSPHSDLQTTTSLSQHTGYYLQKQIQKMKYKQ